MSAGLVGKVCLRRLYSRCKPCRRETKLEAIEEETDRAKHYG